MAHGSTQMGYLCMAISQVSVFIMLTFGLLCKKHFPIITNSIATSFMALVAGLCIFAAEARATKQAISAETSHPGSPELRESVQVLCYHIANCIFTFKRLWCVQSIWFFRTRSPQKPRIQCLGRGFSISKILDFI